MKLPVRALAVDDVSQWQGILKRNLEEVGYRVDVVSNYNEAIELIMTNFYYFAAIDLVLDRRDTRNKDGLLIMEELNRLQDPTKYILLSAYGRMQEGLRAKELGALAVIDKEEWSDEEFRQMALRELDIAKEAIDNMKFDSSFLSAGESETHWSYPILRILRPVDGIRTLDKLCKSVLKGLGPVLYSLAEPSGVFDGGEKVFTAKYWSKMLGFPILLKIGTVDVIEHEKKQAVEMTQSDQSVIRSVRMANIAGIVYCLQKGNRNEYQKKNAKAN